MAEPPKSKPTILSDKVLSEDTDRWLLEAYEDWVEWRAQLRLDLAEADREIRRVGDEIRRRLQEKSAKEATQ